MDSKDSGTVGVEDGVASFNQLVKDMISKRQDMRAFALKTKAMVFLEVKSIEILIQYLFIFFTISSHGSYTLWNKRSNLLEIVNLCIGI